jgi:hypothetical protein
VNNVTEIFRQPYTPPVVANTLEVNLVSSGAVLGVPQARRVDSSDNSFQFIWPVLITRIQASIISHNWKHNLRRSSFLQQEVKQAKASSFTFLTSCV